MAGLGGGGDTTNLGGRGSGNPSVLRGGLVDCLRNKVHVCMSCKAMYSLTCHDHCMNIFNNLWFEAH